VSAAGTVSAFSATVDTHGGVRLGPDPSIEAAMLAWRRGEALARSTKREVIRRGYGHAVMRVLAGLERLGSVDRLVAAYDAEHAALMGVAEAACRDLPEGELLVRGLVVDAACWWHLRRLVAAAVRPVVPSDESAQG
jgi:hypothetical protein